MFNNLQQQFNTNNINMLPKTFNNNINNFNNNNNISRSFNVNNNRNNINISPLDTLNYVPMIGLVNLGQTCYMNSVLQCFSNLYHITNFFLKPKKRNIISQHFKSLGQSVDSLLCFAYMDLIDNLWKGPSNKPFSPKKFKKILQTLNPLFAENTAGDSKDFANYLIMQLHSELNSIETNPEREKINNKACDYIIDPYNKKQVFEAFIADFGMNYSVISRYFYGFTQGQFECQNCKMNGQQGIIKYNYETFFYLEFPLDEVRKHVAQTTNMLQYYQNIDEVDIYDCFNYYQKNNTIVGYCDLCQKDDAQINTKTEIYSPSIILMLIFNRGKGIQFNIKINFQDKLHLTNICLNKTNQYYELQGVVKHFGDNSANGHFIAYCRSAVPSFSNNWYIYNDETVVQVTDWNDIVNKGDTYILFYQLKDMK